MSIFTSAPSEIIDHILNFAPRSDLVTLCRVNQSLRHHAERILYSTVTFEWCYHKIPPIVPLLRTLLHRPELFTYLDTFSLVGNEFTKCLPIYLEIGTSKLPLGQFIPAVIKTQVPYADLWVDRLRAGSMDALVALLVAHLSKTSHLSIISNFVEGFDLVGKVIQSKACGQLCRFEKLNHLAYVKRVDHHQYNHDDAFMETMSIFHLSTVTSIAVWVPNPAVFQWPGEQPPNLDHLTSLEIEWLCPPHISEILARTRSLKSLRWSWDYIRGTGDPCKTPTLDFDQVVTALSHVKNTLRKFHFDLLVGGGRHDDWPTMTMLGSLTGLRDFHITDLHIPLVALTGFTPKAVPLERHIPPTVETLFLTDDMLDDNGVRWHLDEEKCTLSLSQMIAQMIRVLDENSPTCLPRLCHVRLAFHLQWYLFWDLEGDLDALSLGVDTQLVNPQFRYERNP